MTRVGVHEAKTRLSELLRRVEAGEEVIVTRGGRAIARLLPAVGTSAAVSRFGELADEMPDPGDWADDEADALGDLFGLPHGPAS